MSPVLVSLTDEKSFPLNRPSVFIGRDRWRVDVRLPGNAVEEVHCELIQHGTGFRLINLSDAGTMVNGQPVSEAVLEDGDELTIASHRLRLSCDTRASDGHPGVLSDESAEEDWAALNREGNESEESVEPPPEKPSAGPAVDRTAELWKIQLAGLELGPMPWSELKEMVETGQAQLTDPICSASSPDWRPFAEVVSDEDPRPEDPPSIEPSSNAVTKAASTPRPSRARESADESPTSDSGGSEESPQLTDPPGPDADPQFFVMLGETETGPVPLEALQQLALEFRVTGVTLVREENETDWRPAGALPIDIPPPVENDNEEPADEPQPKRELPPATPAQQLLAKVKWLILSPVFYLSNGIQAVLSLSLRTLAVSAVAAVVIGCVFFFWFRGWSQTALTGTLTLDGEPVPAMLVTLTGMRTGDTAVGFTDANGHFSARTLDGEILPGRYHVTVSRLPDGDGHDNEEYSEIPTKYTSLGTTDMIIEVTVESHIYEIPLTAKLSSGNISAER